MLRNDEQIKPDFGSECAAPTLPLGRTNSGKIHSAISTITKPHIHMANVHLCPFLNQNKYMPIGSSESDIRKKKTGLQHSHMLGGSLRFEEIHRQGTYHFHSEAWPSAEA